jgi:dolichyl-phosphate beta-glucosyltransferase
MDACRAIFKASRVDGFAFDVELLYLARHAGLRMREIPVRWNHAEGSKVRFFRDSLLMLREVISLRGRR